jgi:hypothetical protein
MGSKSKKMATKNIMLLPSCLEIRDQLGEGMTLVQLRKAFPMHTKKSLESELKTGLGTGYILLERDIFKSAKAVQNAPAPMVDESMVKDCPQDTTDAPKIDADANDIIQSVLSNILQPFTAPEIAQRTDVIRNHASGYKSAKRAVSLEKALLIASKLGVGDVFVAQLAQASIKFISIQNQSIAGYLE